MDGNNGYGTQPTNGLAIAALICGIAGLILSFTPAAIAAVIMGAIAKGKTYGREMALWGLWLGIIHLIFLVIGIIVAIVIMALPILFGVTLSLPAFLAM